MSPDALAVIALLMSGVGLGMSAVGTIILRREHREWKRWLRNMHDHQDDRP